MRLVLQRNHLPLGRAVGAHPTHEHDDAAKRGPLELSERVPEGEGSGRQSDRHGLATPVRRMYREFIAGADPLGRVTEGLAVAEDPARDQDPSEGGVFLGQLLEELPGRDPVGRHGPVDAATTDRGPGRREQQHSGRRRSSPPVLWRQNRPRVPQPANRLIHTHPRMAGCRTSRFVSAVKRGTASLPSVRRSRAASRASACTSLG